MCSSKWCYKHLLYDHLQHLLGLVSACTCRISFWMILGQRNAKNAHECSIAGEILQATAATVGVVASSADMSFEES